LNPSFFFFIHHASASDWVLLFAKPPKPKSPHQSLLPKKSHRKIPNPKKSSDRKFQPKKELHRTDRGTDSGIYSVFIAEKHDVAISKPYSQTRIRKKWFIRGAMSIIFSISLKRY